ncbi:hypothetical protein BV25DRAFT_1919743 [Artomyces pyxidatus]|uniref:Uncharacterized protein n=1 Tax=Artomyces pyxidatus TaxID=48021 RepID=A0ACB8SPV3_9AGAM|nr:hypothetical protein BV25DRAFT_1919743 [Artomyces pyxidatus]
MPLGLRNRLILPNDLEDDLHPSFNLQLDVLAMCVLMDGDNAKMLLLPNGDLAATSLSTGCYLLPSERAVVQAEDDHYEDVYYLLDPDLWTTGREAVWATFTRLIHFEWDVPLPPYRSFTPPLPEPEQRPIGYWWPPPQSLSIVVGREYFLVGHHGQPHGVYSSQDQNVTVFIRKIHRDYITVAYNPSMVLPIHHDEFPLFPVTCIVCDRRSGLRWGRTHYPILSVNTFALNHNSDDTSLFLLDTSPLQPSDLPSLHSV